jgi:hypothetical protein
MTAHEHIDALAAYIERQARDKAQLERDNITLTAECERLEAENARLHMEIAVTAGANDPATVLALLDVVEAAEGVLKMLDFEQHAPRPGIDDTRAALDRLKEVLR